VTPTIIVQPAVEPVSWDEAKAWTNALDADEALVRGLISAARELCEHRRSEAFYLQTLEILLDRWPYDGFIRLPRARPLHDVLWVRYIDEGGIERTVSPSEYYVSASAGGIGLLSGFDRPSLYPHAILPLSIRYRAGDNSSPLKPVAESIRLAMRLLIAHWYANREAVVVGLPLGVDALLSVDQRTFSF
jgi:uncharacterized phiE125 gp8 family phage protein